MSRSTRLGWITAICVLSGAELLLLPADMPARLCALAGFAAAMLALGVWFGDLKGTRARPPEPAFLRESTAPKMPMMQRLALERAAALGEPIPSQPTSSFPERPRFGTRRSLAHTAPWLLPATPAHSGVAADEALVGGLTIRAASVVGAGHRCEQPAVPRQDAYRLARDATSRFAVIAVADGASEAKLSHIGAATAVDCVVDVCVRQLNAHGSVDFHDAFEATADTLETVAKRRRIDSGELSCALIVAVVDSVAVGGSRPAYVGWIGDVSAWQLSDDGFTQAAGDHSDATLPQRPDKVQTTTINLADGVRLAVATDGIGDVISMVPEAGAYFGQRWQRPPAVAEFLHDVGFEVVKQQDDRTVVVVWTSS